MSSVQPPVDPRTWAAPPPSGIRRVVPIVRWLPDYDRRWLRFDVIAGATVWGLLAPESMAYAGLAGLPPQAGLYTLLVTLAAYAVFGTSRHVVAAATSAAAVLLAFVTVSQLPKLFGIEKGSGDTIKQFIHLVGHLGDTSGATLAVGAGALLLLFVVERLAPKTPGGLLGQLGHDRVFHTVDAAVQALAGAPESRRLGEREGLEVR